MFLIPYFGSFAMVVPVDIAKGNGVSVLHTDGHRYECKVMKNEGGKLLLHWHGFGRKYPEFQLAHDSDELGLLEDANVLPPPPTKSLKEKDKQGAVAYVSGNQPPESDASGDQPLRCNVCSGEVMDVHIKCDFCGSVLHLTCSGVPDYMLIRHMHTEQGYMCEPCVMERWSSDKISVAKIKIKDTKQKESEVNNPTVQLEHTGGKANTPKPDPPMNVCQRYRRGQCPHGKKGKKLVAGKKCPYAHPPKCWKFCSAGSDKHHGCQKGKKCNYLHPVLCPSAKGDGVCNRHDCKLTHLKRKRERNDNLRPVLDSSNSKTRVRIMGSSGGGLDTNQEPPRAPASRVNTEAALTPSKNGSLERIEEMILLMQKKHDEELSALRQEIAQSRGPSMPWMGPYYQWMNPPTWYSRNMPHSSS